MKNYYSALLIGTLLLVSCTQNNTTEYSDTFIKTYNQIPEEYRFSKELNMCLANNLNYCHQTQVQKKAQLGKNTLICDELSTDGAQQQCKESIYGLLALDKDNLDDCEQITTDQGKLGCKYSIIAQRARLKKDISICKSLQIGSNNEDIQISGMEQEYEIARNNCINDISKSIAFETLDITFCKKISSEENMNICIEKITETQKQIDSFSSPKTGTGQKEKATTKAILDALSK